MNLDFSPISLDMRDDYNSLWDLCSQKSSDQSFTILWAWAQPYGYELAFERDENLAWIRETRPADRPMYLPPVGDWAKPDWPDILRARFPDDVCFYLVPENLALLWKEQLGNDATLVEERDRFEYLYNASDLRTLAGNKYMRKRNRINQFRKQTPYAYVPLAPERFERVAEFQRTWCETHRHFNIQNIEEENEAILSTLNHWKNLPNLSGGIIEIAGTIIAYTIAEAVGEAVMIHFEKASLQYGAAYQVINHEFLLHDGKAFSLVNREEDMGEPGLRDAKMSYHPVDFLKKYTVKIRL